MRPAGTPRKAPAGPWKITRGGTMKALKTAGCVLGCLVAVAVVLWALASMVGAGPS